MFQIPSQNETAAEYFQNNNSYNNVYVNRKLDLTHKKEKKKQRMNEQNIVVS